MWKPVLLVVVTTGCQIAQVDVDVEEIRLVYHDVAIQDAHGLKAAQHSFVFDDLSVVQQLVDRGGKVSFTSVALRATSGVDSLSFVDGIEISLASGDPESQLEPMMVSECERTCKIHDASLDLDAPRGRDATLYVSTGSLLLGIDMRGQLPAKDWTLDFEVVLHASLEYAVDP